MYSKTDSLIPFNIIYRAFLCFVLPLIILACHASMALAAEATLTWDPNTEADLAGYKIYYGFQTGNYEYAIDVGNQTTYTVTGLEENQPIYFVATAYNMDGIESDYSKEVVFESVNQSPVADAGPDQTVEEGTAVTLNGTNSSDPEGSTLSYLWEQTGGDINVQISNASSAQAGIVAPSTGADGVSLLFRLTVTDGVGLTAEDYCVINVSGKNTAPTADAGPDLTVASGDEVTLDGSASSDPDDGISAVYWRQVSGPEVEIVDSNQLVISFVAPELTTESASLTFELAVQDQGGLIARDTCVVNVTWLNEAPTADAGTDQAVYAGDSVRLDGSGSTDPEDNIAAYRWTQTGGTVVTLTDPNSVKPGFTAPQVEKLETLTFELTVTDDGGLKSQDTCKVTVNPDAPGVVPTLSIMANKSDGTDGPVRISKQVPVSLTISVDPVDFGGAAKDLWLIADTAGGRWYYKEGFGWYDQPTPYAQTAIDAGISTKAFKDKLPVGNYSFTFAIDDNSDGIFNGTWTNTVLVEVGTWTNTVRQVEVQ